MFFSLSSHQNTLSAPSGCFTARGEAGSPDPAAAKFRTVSGSSYLVSGDGASNHPAGSGKSNMKRLAEFLCCIKPPEPEKYPTVCISSGQLWSAKLKGCLDNLDFALVDAVLHGTLKDVEALLTEDNVNRVRYENRPLLLWTCGSKASENQLAIQKFMLEKGADVYGSGAGSGITALHLAALHGLVDSVQQLFEHGGKKLLKMKENGGWTALMYAAVNGQRQENQAIYHFLVENGATPGKAWKDAEGNKYTPADVLRGNMETQEKGWDDNSSQSDCLYGLRRLFRKMVELSDVRGG